jgi:DinB superfamily
MDPTQVIRQPDGTMQCRECGFRYTLTSEEVAIRAGRALAAVRAAVASIPEQDRNRRPAPRVWSVNAYTAHLADAIDVIYARIQSIAELDRPLLAWHDQDQAVEDGHQNEKPVADSLEQLEVTVPTCQAYVRTLPYAAWARVGVHSRAGEVRLPISLKTLRTSWNITRPISAASALR